MTQHLHDASGDDLPDLTDVPDVEVIADGSPELAAAFNSLLGPVSADADSNRDPSPDLDDLLAESQPTAIAQATGDLLDDLDSLLAESVAAVNEAKAAKLARERLKRGGAYAEKEEDLARIRDWESKHVWQARANVALFIQHQCACGTGNNVFEGIFRREEHRHMPGAMHWIKVETAKADLPNETVIQAKSTPVCNNCAAIKGWDTEKNFISWGDAEEIDEGANHEPTA